jgi:hypothetical protein
LGVGPRQVWWARSTKRALPDSICRLLEAISSRLELQNSHRQHLTSKAATPANSHLSETWVHERRTERAREGKFSILLFPFNNSPTAAHTRTKRRQRFMGKSIRNFVSLRSPHDFAQPPTHRRPIAKRSLRCVQRIIEWRPFF